MGNDGNTGTQANPRGTITGGLAGSGSRGQDELRVAGGSYDAFTVVAGVDVLGGYDQSFALGGGDGADDGHGDRRRQPARRHGDSGDGPDHVEQAHDPGRQRQHGCRCHRRAGAVRSVLTLDEVVVDSGTPSAAGSSAYGVRAISGAAVTLTDSTVNADNGVAGTDGADGGTGAGRHHGQPGVSGGMPARPCPVNH